MRATSLCSAIVNNEIPEVAEPKNFVRNFTETAFLLGLTVLPFVWVESSPNFFPNAVDHRARLEMGLAEFREAQAAPSGPSVASLQLSFEKALSEGQIAKARTVLQQLLEHSLSSEALSRLGVALAQQELYSEAVEVFTRWANDYPKMFEPHYNLALAYLALQRYSEALSTLEKAPESSKAEGTARLYMRGKILEALGRTGEAEQSLATAFSGAPQQENYALDLGLLYLRQRAYPKATAVFSRGSSFHPRSTYLLLGLSLAQFLGGRSLESVETCRKLLAFDASFSAGRLLLGFALYQKGDFEEAERIAAEGLSAPHPNPYLFYLRAASLLKLQSQDYDRISQDLAAANAVIPECTLCHLAQSKVHEARGDLQSAIDELEQAVKLDPNFEEAWYHLSTAYARMGRREEATKASVEFSRLKSEKTDRDTEILRDMFLKTLAAQE